jgi:hypothetical protein
MIATMAGLALLMSFFIAVMAAYWIRKSLAAFPLQRRVEGAPAIQALLACPAIAFTRNPMTWTVSWSGPDMQALAKITRMATPGLLAIGNDDDEPWLAK